MKQRSIGGTPVSAIGLGEMPMSIEGRPDDEAQSIRTIHTALDAGVTLIDTADAYSRTIDDFGHGEELVAKALKSYGGDTSHVLVATKGGHIRDADGGWQVNGNASYLKTAAQRSLDRLGVDAIGLYQFHRPDPTVSYSDSIGALQELLDAGLIRLAGISNATVEQIRQANDILGGRLASVQNQFAPNFRSSEPELEYCAANGIAFLPWSPLGGIGNTDKNIGSVFEEIGQAHGVSKQQVCLAWELAKADVVIPIPGSKRPETITDSAKAPEVTLSADELKRLDSV